MFRDDTQRSAVCRGILKWTKKLEQLWTDDGPSDAALELLAQDGGPLSSGERIMLLVAMDAWNGCGRVRFEEVMFSLDASALYAVATFLVAFSGVGSRDMFGRLLDGKRDPLDVWIVENGRRVVENDDAMRALVARLERVQ